LIKGFGTKTLLHKRSKATIWPLCSFFMKGN
jgi:hypothetical protein